MTLIKLESGRRILIDANIRKPDDEIRDVADDLRKDLELDENNRPYVDVMVLSHPDQDHCRGFAEHFHVGSLRDYNDRVTPKKIIIREMWSSPLVFRRSNEKNHTLCDDAKTWATEARRRVNRYKQFKSYSHGDRIKILGEDINGKTDGIQEIVVKAGASIHSICGTDEPNFVAELLAPMLAKDEEEDKLLGKNESSIIMNYSIGVGGTPNAAKYLSGGDAEVGIWERIWGKYKGDIAKLQYNLLGTPHHCSWHSLSWDSLSDLGSKAQVSSDAVRALNQALPGAIIVASSKQILDDEKDPPSFRAMQEYKKITDGVKGEFWNTGSYLTPAKPALLIFEVSEGGLKKITKSALGAAGAVGGGFGSTPLHHG
ncbi:Conserved hypothetical protein, putative metallo-hydrolase [Herminiimonas arsenicoxydans]|jgi:hypothetical protein|uniref:Metallohydrolase n=1 Tax=Herminiimonas arsenicoxydans TaxID=204773 RepID=A4G9X3_HERAR|nr:Conserved hypothetical protein, putative metallo-hydrolase [Herminiimonas arsenicoxydans]